MSFFEDASLVLIPSAQKTSKVYSVKPTDGTGDLTFTRSNDTATRVGPDGLIEKVRTNLISYSEQFNDASWTKDGSTITANSTANPLDGAMTADTWTSTAFPSFLFKSVALNAGEHSLSIYAKAGASSSLRMDFITSGFAQGASLTFDLSAGTAGTITQYGTASGFVANVQSLGNGWYRCSLTGNIPAGTYASQFFIGSGSVIVFGNQLETGVVTPYIATTSAAVSVGPVANVPRLDYLNSSCPRLLLEPQRTNLVTYSEQMNNAAWVKIQITTTANSSASPDGYTNADKIAIDNGVSGGYAYQSIATTSSTVYTSSFFIKAAGVNFTKFYSNVTGSYVTAVINLTTGAITNSGFAVTPTATNYGNGWWRVSYTETSGGGNVPIYVDAGSTSNGGAITGNGTDGILIWGAQVEAGAYATSYIPTLGAAVTRSADAASKTGISALIGQTEGTLFLEVDKTSRVDSDFRFQISDGTTNNWLFVGVDVGNNIRAYVNVGGVNQFSVYGAAVTSGIHKVAIAYKANDFKVYVDGVAWITQTSGSVPTCSRLDIGAAAPTTQATTDSKTSQALLFKTRLTNAQLAELTTI